MKRYTFEMGSVFRLLVDADDDDKAVQRAKEVILENLGKDGTLPVDMKIGWHSGTLSVAVPAISPAAIANVAEKPEAPF